MRDIDVHFTQIEKNDFGLLYNGESFNIHIYNDGNFHNRLYECDKEIPEELEWFVDKVIEKEMNQRGYIGRYKQWILKDDELPNAYEEVEILMKNGEIHVDMIVRGKYGNLEWRNYVDSEIKAWREK